MQILAMLGKLIVKLVIVLLIVTFATFAMLKFLPGDPVEKLKPVSTAEQRAAIREDLGLNEGYFQQYFDWLQGFVTGDLGRDYGNNQTVTTKLKDSAPVSLQLVGYSIFLSMIVAIPLGVLTAYRSGTRLDRTASATAFGLLAIPNFVLGLILATYLGAQWKLLPTQGYVKIGVDPVEHFRFMALPVIALAVGQIAVYMRLLRSDMIATLQENFVTTAKAKGISPRRVLFRHALRPSSLTLLTVVGLNMGTLIGGAIIIEVIFGLPGMGREIAAAILTNQYVVLQSYVALIAIGYVLINFTIDLAYSVLDPRIRRAS